VATQGARSYTLHGFPAAATRFVSALEANRRRIAQDAGLNDTELRALFHVAREVSVTPKALATYLGLTTGAVTAVARGLVDKGMLHRIDRPDDRRSLYLELTPDGHERMRGIHEDFNRMIAESTSALSAEELDRFTDALRVVANEVRERLDGARSQD